MRLTPGDADHDLLTKEGLARFVLMESFCFSFVVSTCAVWRCLETL